MSFQNQSYSIIKDREIIAAAWHETFLKDNLLLNDVYQKNYPAVRNYVLTNQGDAARAEDLYQEAFLAVWRNIRLGRFLPQREGDFAAYLMRVSRNKWIDHLRAHGSKRTVTLQEEHHGSKDEDPAHDEQDAFIGLVIKHFHNLAGNCKDLLTRFYYKKNTMRQIAQHFGWTEASARNNKYRCLQKLRESIKNEKP